MTRERYLDVLRAFALARVIGYHLFGGAWLSFVFPAMGVMFALGGSLMARSLANTYASGVVYGRFRRLLPAYWVFGAAVVFAMAVHGLVHRPHWTEWLPWVVPYDSPVGDDWVQPATEVLWYLATYLWLVVVSPAALWAYHRRPFLTVATPLLALAVATWTGAPEVILNVATFGACWVTGFAHRRGDLRRLGTPVLVSLAVGLLAAGTLWALTHPADGGYDLNEIPLAQGLYSLGFVLLALRAPVPVGWLTRRPWLDRAVSWVNSRAVTIYLWHNPAIAASFVVGDALSAYRLGEVGYLPVALVLLALPLLAFGRVEDWAARKRPTRPSTSDVPALVRERWGPS